MFFLRLVTRCFLIKFVLPSGVGTKGVNGKLKNECRVTPPALMAATPVGATTTRFFGQLFFNSFRKVVLPVPAFPVIKTEHDVWLAKSLAI